MPGVLIGAVVLAFAKSITMWVMVPAWLVFAHRLGITAHCPPKEKKRGRKESPQDPQDGPDGQQPEEERQEHAAAHRER
jgi:hypothetical protein